MKNICSRSPYRGSGSITREQFLFFEMKTTAKMLLEGLDDEQIIERIYTDNLFQYPTTKSVKSIVKACLKRLHGLEDDDLVRVIASSPNHEAKQVCLYAMMRQYRLIYDFMSHVIGEKYRTLNSSINEGDIKRFLDSLREQDDTVAHWSETTITKLKQIMKRILVITEYQTDPGSETLLSVYLSPVLEEYLRKNDPKALCAFNCFI